MPDKPAALAHSIEAIVGDENVTEESTLTVDGIRPELIARPASPEEIAACLKVCSELAAAVVPAGRMTWLECGNPIRCADVVLSTERMRRIIEYSPPDLTATIEGGLALSELNGVTMQERQWLPLDPPGFRTASLGAVAACNSSGALRLGFGTPRDYVIGLQLVHADGTESKSGGRVVKNVAGYDMNKLYVGSYGTLAIISAITFKLRPLPERASTVAITAKQRGPLLDLAARVLASELQPASLVLARRLASLSADALLVRFIDSEASVTSQMDWVMDAVVEGSSATAMSNDEAEAIWAEVVDFDGGAIGVRISVPLSVVAAEFERVLEAQPNCAATADIGAGIIRMSFDADGGADKIRRLREQATQAGGTLIIERAPLEVRREVDAWGEVGATAELMRSIKARFDPQSILNPGKFISGI